MGDRIDRGKGMYVYPGGWAGRGEEGRERN